MDTAARFNAGHESEDTGMNIQQTRIHYETLALAVAQQRALVAIVARINGEWDSPALQHYGTLGSMQADILRIANTTLGGTT